MKSIRWVLASMMMFALTGGVLAGCAAGAADEEGDENITEVGQALGSNACTKTYYSDASMTVVVGSCLLPSTCTGSFSQCTGTKTSYWTEDCVPCSEWP